VTQSTAQAICLVKGGRLALVSSADELSAVQTFIQSEGLGPTNGVWLDGSDAKEKGTWRSSTGETMSYLGWGATEPNGGTVENCIRLFRLNVRDYSCDSIDNVVAALCEY